MQSPERESGSFRRPITKFIKKNEPKPKFINADLENFYNSTDLEYIFVYDQCKILGARKMIDISPATITAWYIEMIKLEWTRKNFLDRLAAVSRKEVYNRIDWADWINAGSIMYAEHEFEKRVENRISAIISSGKRLKILLENGIKLTQEEVKEIELAAASELRFEFHVERQKLIEQHKERVKQNLRIFNRQKRSAISGLSREKKDSLLNDCIAAGIFQRKEFDITLKYLPHFAELIPEDIFSKYSGAREGVC